MRRLLVFGTGAAVIGIVLLIVAFYEAYLIVSTLQTNVGQSITNTNLLLEDATLEAVFLGVMAALGYGLVAKGLDGIRRQELLEMEGAAEVTYGRGPLAVGEDQSRYVVKAGGPTQAQVAETESADSHPGIKRPAAAAVVKPAEAKKDFPGPGDKKLPPIWGAPKAPLQEPVSSGDRGTTSPESHADFGGTTEAGSGSGAETLTTTSTATASASTSEPAAGTSQDTRTGEVVWEGGAPPTLEGVEVLPEPTAHGTAALDEQSARPVGSPGEVPIDPLTGLPIKPKRGRGRPKGSKSSKKLGEAAAQDDSAETENQS